MAKIKRQGGRFKELTFEDVGLAPVPMFDVNNSDYSEKKSGKSNASSGKKKQSSGRYYELKNMSKESLASTKAKHELKKTEEKKKKEKRTEENIKSKSEKFDNIIASRNKQKNIIKGTQGELKISSSKIKNSEMTAKSGQEDLDSQDNFESVKISNNGSDEYQSLEEITIYSNGSSYTIQSCEEINFYDTNSKSTQSNNQTETTQVNLGIVNLSQEILSNEYIQDEYENNGPSQIWNNLQNTTDYTTEIEIINEIKDLDYYIDTQKYPYSDNLTMESTENNELPDSSQLLDSNLINPSELVKKSDQGIYEDREKKKQLSDSLELNLTTDDKDSKNKKSKSQVLYSLAHSIWDLVKPVDFNNLEEKFSTIKQETQTIDILGSESEISDTEFLDKTYKKDNCNASDIGLDNYKVYTLGESVTYSVLTNEDNNPKSLENNSKNNCDYTKNCNINVVEDDKTKLSNENLSNSNEESSIKELVIENSNTFQLNNNEENTVDLKIQSAPRRKSKRQVLYSLANSVWDYVRPISLDELEERQRNANMQKNKIDINLDNISKNQGDNTVSKVEDLQEDIIQEKEDDKLKNKILSSNNIENFESCILNKLVNKIEEFCLEKDLSKEKYKESITLDRKMIEVPINPFLIGETESNQDNTSNSCIMTSSLNEVNESNFQKEKVQNLRLNDDKINDNIYENLLNFPDKKLNKTYDSYEDLLVKPSSLDLISTSNYILEDIYDVTEQTFQKSIEALVKTSQNDYMKCNIEYLPDSLEDSQDKSLVNIGNEAWEDNKYQYTSSYLNKKHTDLIQYCDINETSKLSEINQDICSKSKEFKRTKKKDYHIQFLKLKQKYEVLKKQYRIELEKINQKSNIVEFQNAIVLNTIMLPAININEKPLITVRLVAIQISHNKEISIGCKREVESHIYQTKTYEKSCNTDFIVGKTTSDKGTNTDLQDCYNFGNITKNHNNNQKCQSYNLEKGIQYNQKHIPPIIINSEHKDMLGIESNSQKKSEVQDFNQINTESKYLSKKSDIIRDLNNRYKYSKPNNAQYEVIKYNSNINDKISSTYFDHYQRLIKHYSEPSLESIPDDSTFSSIYCKGNNYQKNYYNQTNNKLTTSINIDNPTLHTNEPEIYNNSQYNHIYYNIQRYNGYEACNNAHNNKYYKIVHK
ncbi:uncharacterized protein CMU_039550 [Cryptosporidium muris RN66]|uniref:Uncharacterized protein n=1 Tax=Cryptosporidium muris (strain RN66) TaxID=441375 RepID=B6A9J5_CRYMR|nr:uncharacterized protein CMU_039550 [Cryptosporidium muris RN66]EEA04886.1 hypothetical protein CMU_039550 [Cryptosporidium muris RN66]|eukprot:XP_002139235.1 hypothetical protein [Cryptosporidium muris RN66]